MAYGYVRLCVPVPVHMCGCLPSNANEIYKAKMSSLANEKKKSIKGTLFLNAAHFPAAVFCLYIGVHSISMVSSRY